MHTSFQHLIDYLEERLNAEGVATVSLHLACCLECQRTLMLASQFLTNTRDRQQQKAASRAMSRPFVSAAAIGMTTYPPSSIGEQLARG